MTEVQVCLGAIVCDKDLPVLVRTHGAGIHVDVRIEFLCGNFQSSCLEQTAERRGGDSFAETGHNPSGHEYEFWHGVKSFLLF